MSKLREQKAQKKREELIAALHRIEEGQPNRVKPGQLSISAVEKEANVPNGTLKYHLYEDLFLEIKDKIDSIKLFDFKIQREGRGTTSEKRLRAEREKEKQIKERYRNERNELIEQNKTLLGRYQWMAEELDIATSELVDANEKIKQLEQQIKELKEKGTSTVIPFSKL